MDWWLQQGRLLDLLLEVTITVFPFPHLSCSILLVEGEACRDRVTLLLGVPGNVLADAEFAAFPAPSTRRRAAQTLSFQLMPQSGSYRDQIMVELCSALFCLVKDAPKVYNS